MRLLKRLRAVRLIYSSEHHCHIPYQFRRQADLYVKAVKAGLTVTKEAA